MHRAFMLAALFALAVVPAQARSNAATYLINQEIAAACNGSEGEIDPASVIERDLTGDGESDLIISHGGISCSGGGRSSLCGAQICAVNFYVRRGPLLELEHTTLGAAVTVGGGATPKIQMYGEGLRPAAVQWNGQTFR